MAEILDRQGFTHARLIQAVRLADVTVSDFARALALQAAALTDFDNDIGSAVFSFTLKAEDLLAKAIEYAQQRKHRAVDDHRAGTS